MICQFSFKNFKSYKDETILDFQASTLSEYKDSLITTDKGVDLLPVNVIYGPNGGGKSNVLDALTCLISTVVKPIYDLQKNHEQFILQQQVACAPFSFDRISRQEPTEFNIYFRINDNEYRYYISLFEDVVVSESLFRRTLGGKKTAILFTRERNVVELGASINKNNLNKEVNPKMPYLSFLAINYNIPQIVEAQKWFESCIIRNYSDPKLERRILIAEDDDFKIKFIGALNDMGIDVSDYIFDKESNQLIVKKKISNEVYSLPFSSESAGTQKLFAALPLILKGLIDGKLVIIDELDSKLHPKLLRYIISLFTNKEINKKGAQLLFSSHDMSTMKNDVFRRDEIWFAALNEGHSSDLYSLYEIRKLDGKHINPTASYDKQYLEGRYGADPYLSAMLDWEVN